MTVKGIGKVVTVKHDDVKRRLSDLRYKPEFQNNLISLGRLEVKGFTFKPIKVEVSLLTWSLLRVENVRTS